MPATTHVPPVLETARLRLRGHATGDLEASFEMWSNPVVTRHIGGKPSSREEVWSRLLRYMGHWTALGFGYWVAEEKSSGRFVGEVGFADFHRELEPSLQGAPEIGWVLAPWAHGQGLATEAVTSVLAWGEKHFPAGRTVCLIDPGNAPSLRVAQKCGFREFARATYKGAPTLVFERMALPAPSGG